MSAETKTLTLIRHAKSSWKEPGLADFERPLNGRGKRDAPLMGGILSETLGAPDLFLTSPARRALKTARIVAKAIGYDKSNLRVVEEIYGAGVAVLLQIVAGVEDRFGRVFLCGHNPGLTALAVRLADRPIGDMPTMGVLAIRFPAASWQSVGSVKGEVILFDYPKNHT